MDKAEGLSAEECQKKVPVPGKKTKAL